MSDKNKRTNKIRNFSIGSLLVTLILYAIFGTAYGVILWMWGSGCDQVHGEYAAIKNGVVVEAELNDVRSTVDRSSNSFTVRYNVIYEYIDGDTRYRGIAVYNVNEYYEAEKYLGKKIKIYIDGKGHSLPVGSKPELMTVIVLTVFVVGLFYPMLFWPLLLKQIVRWKEKRKLRKQQNKPGLFSLYVQPKDNQDKDE